MAGYMGKWKAWHLRTDILWRHEEEIVEVGRGRLYSGNIG